jgi:hypothetical protein
MHWMRAACILAPIRVGKSSEARIAMIAMTTSNSMSVKAAAGKNIPPVCRTFLTGTRQPVVKNFRGIGLTATLYLFHF